MPNFIYDIIPPEIKRKAEAAVREVSRWIKIVKLFLKTSKYGSIVLLVGIIAFGALLVFAIQSDAETLEVFPTQVSGDWNNKESALQKELNNDSVLVEFSSENSANLFGREFIQPIEESKGTETIESEEKIIPEGEEEIVSESEEQLEQEGEEVLGEEIQEQASVSEEPTMEPIQESPVVEPIEEQPQEEQIQIEEPATEEPQEQIPEGGTEVNLIEFWKQLGIAIGGEEEVVATETPETETIPSEEVILEENINEEITTESETKDDADELLNLIEQAEKMPSISEPNLITHSLVFSGFESEKIGEINRAQLAFSWAVQKRETNEILLVEYKLSDNEWKTLFLIQLNTEEHSNFSNNGYWKKGIPEILSWEDINGLEVRFTLQSINLESEKPIYLDAVWLEVEYKPSKELEEIEEPIVDNPPLGPDFLNYAIKQDVQDGNIRAVIIEKGGMLELWYGIINNTDLNAMTWNFLTGDSAIDNNSPLRLRGNTIFWLDKNKQTIFGYAIDEQSIFGKPIETEGKEFYLEFQNKDLGLWRAVFDPINNKFNFAESPSENQ